MQAARETYEALSKMHLAGKGDVEPLVVWSRRWMEAQRELSNSKVGQIAAVESHLARITELTQLTKAKFDAGRVPVYEYTAMVYFRTEAQILLARAKAKDKEKEKDKEKK
jgi:hypothetical protein